jgi:glycosyltransferase involved in cell wall biosynthesis
VFPSSALTSLDTPGRVRYGGGVVSSSAEIAPTLDATPPAPDGSLEVSVVMPCLNEADTLEVCVRKALRAFEAAGIAGEVVVADNGSTDGSQAIAERAGARVVPVRFRGYGNALMGGIAAARGRFVIMGDADDSYDFGEVPKIVAKLREGNALVQGCRLPSGGGTIMPGAMPFLHRWWGNPMFSAIARRWFGAPIHDIYCGLRGFTKELYERLDQRCTGMEFATEMIIKASLHRERIAEVPITLHPDGRKAHKPHLKTFRDGWRTLRFFLLYSPRWLFLMPGFALILLGLVGYGLGLPGAVIRGVRFEAHTLLFASVAILCGYQSVIFAVFTKVFAISEKLVPDTPNMKRVFRVFTLERGLIAGAAMFVSGVGLLMAAVAMWWRAGFGNLDYPQTMRLVVPGATLTALGFQTVLSSFFMSVLGLKRR